MHADHTRVERVVLVEGPLAHQGAADRRIEAMRKSRERLCGIRQNHAAARHDAGLFRSLEKRKRFFDFLFRRKRAQGLGRRQNRLIVGHRRRHILRDIDQHRPRTTAPRNPKSAAQHACELPHIFDNEVVLGNRHADTGDVDLLERVLSEDWIGNITGDCDNRRRVHVGARNAGDQVRRAGAAGREAHADFAARARITVGRVCGALLVTGQHMVNFIPVLVKCIINIQNRAARITEDGIDALFLEAGDYNFRTAQFSHGASLPPRAQRPAVRRSQARDSEPDSRPPH